jgi:hypothetical protein
MVAALRRRNLEARAARGARRAAGGRAAARGGFGLGRAAAAGMASQRLLAAGAHPAVDDADEHRALGLRNPRVLVEGEIRGRRHLARAQRVWIGDAKGGSRSGFRFCGRRRPNWHRAVAVAAVLR